MIGGQANGGNALGQTGKGEWLVPVPSTFWVDSTNENDVIVVAPPAYAGGV